MSAPDPPPPTSGSSPRRSVKAANQPRWVGWVATLGASCVVLGLLAYGVALAISSRLLPPANIAYLAFFTLLALWVLLNPVELELSPERISIRSRWRHFVRAQPRELVLPPDAAIVVEGGIVRVGGWSAGFWKLSRIAAVAREAGVALEVRQRPMVRQTRARRLGTTVGAVTLVAVVFVAPGIAAHVWDPNLSPFDLLEIAWSVWLGILSLGAFALLRLRFRMERAVPGDAIEPIRGPA